MKGCLSAPVFLFVVGIDVVPLVEVAVAVDAALAEKQKLVDKMEDLRQPTRTRLLHFPGWTWRQASYAKGRARTERA